MNTIPLDEIVPFGTKVVCRDEAGVAEWTFGDAIRQGGTGRVYEVFECRIPFRHGAIKLLRPDRDDAAAAFNREGERLMGRVAGEHGPMFFGRGTFRGRPFVIMEFARPIRRGLSIREALTFVDELADGLSTLHANGFCHGDIKPYNLGLFDGRPGLLDFGSVRPIIPDGTSGNVTRTPGYSAPELEDNGCAAPWVDVYGLAATLNEILSPKALDAFASVLRAGMHLRAEARIQTPKEFASTMHGCHRAHRCFGVVAKWVTAAVAACARAAAAAEIVVGDCDCSGAGSQGCVDDDFNQVFDFGRDDLGVRGVAEVQPELARDQRAVAPGGAGDVAPDRDVGSDRLTERDCGRRNDEARRFADLVFGRLGRRSGERELGTTRRQDGGGGVGRGVALNVSGRIAHRGAVLGSAEEGRECEREENDKLREAFGSAKAFEGCQERAAKEDEEQGRRAG